MWLRQGYTRCNERRSVIISSFTYLLCLRCVPYIPPPASRCQCLDECAADALRCAAAEARLFCTDRGSSLIRAWPLWLAVPEREAAWRYNTRPSRCTKTSIISWSPQEVALYAGSWYSKMSCAYCCFTWILTSTVQSAESDFDTRRTFQ